MGVFVAVIYVKFLDILFFDILDLNKFLTVLLAFLSSISSKILLSSILNIFEINNFDNSVIFNIKIINTAILLKP